MNAPTIATGRLLLVAPRASLFDAHHAMVSDPRVAAWIGGPPSRFEAWRRYCQAAGLWALLGYGYWTVLDRASGRLIGFGGLACFERGIAALDGVPEAGWAFARECWGQGIASEFLAAVMRWSDDELGAPALRCLIDANNGASIRVAQKNGFAVMAPVPNDAGDALVFARPASGQA